MITHSVAVAGLVGDVPGLAGDIVHFFGMGFGRGRGGKPSSGPES